MAVSYPTRLSLARIPTPLHPMDRLSAELGGPRLWIKRDDLTDCAMAGNKLRKLEFSLAEARARGCDTILTCGGIQSNHCRATAIAGAMLGFKVHLVLRGMAEGAPDGNLLLDKLVGAEITHLPLAEYQRGRDALFAELAESYAAKGHKAFIIPTGASDEIGAWGYIAACEEMKDDFARLGFTPEHIISATGSGGTTAGLILGNALHSLGAEVHGFNVCNDAESFRKWILADLIKWKDVYTQSLEVESLPINIIDGYVGPGYAIAEPPVFETIRHVARTEGVILDPVYTGKAFHGMLEEIRRGRFAGAKNILFVHTGGIFGLIAQREKVFAA